MSEDEKIVLDAKVTDVLSERAFRAQLRNGHGLVAFVAGAEGRQVAWAVNDRVLVELSPFDMSKGRILGPASGDLQS